MGLRGKEGRRKGDGKRGREREIDRTRVRNSLGTIVCTVGSSVEFCRRRYMLRTLLVDRCCAVENASPCRYLNADPSTILVPRFGDFAQGNIRWTDTWGESETLVRKPPGTSEGYRLPGI